LTPTLTPTGALLTYLDLGHWIGLSKARVGHPDGARYQPLLKRLREATTTGHLKMVVGAEHHAEIQDRIKDVRQRHDIAVTMGELTRYATLASRHQLLLAECRRSVSEEFGLPAPLAPSTEVIGHGVGHTLGHPFRGRIQGPGSDDASIWDERVSTAIDHLELDIGSGWRFSRHGEAPSKELLEAAFNEAAEFMLLRGPAPENVQKLRDEYGYRPEEAAAVMTTIAERERHIAEVVRRDKGRVHDLVGASTYVYDLNPTIMPSVLGELGMPPDALVRLGKAALMRVLDRMPILDVEMALRRPLLKNRDYKVSVNDIYDQAGLGQAVAYCDVVLTDRSAADRLKKARVDRRYQCQVFATPEELLGFLEGDSHAAQPPSDLAAAGQ
jgi:hypothetical protein